MDPTSSDLSPCRQRRADIGALISAIALSLAGCQPATAPPLIGYVEAEFVHVAAPLAGRLVALPVQRGAEVAAGAPLFTLDSDNEAAAVRESQARSRQAQAQARDLDKGQRRDELAALQAAVDAANASLAQSSSELARLRALADAGFLSGAGLEAQAAKTDADGARVRQLQAQLRVARLGAREDQRSAARAGSETAQAQLAQAQWRLTQKAVSAPVAARVDDTLYRVGEWVPAGSPVVRLLPPDALKLRFFVPETQLTRVQPGTHVQVHCDGCPAPLPATVRFVARLAEFAPPVIYSKENRQRLVFMVEAWPAPADAQKLRPGLPVQVDLPTPGT